MSLSIIKYDLIDAWKKGAVVCITTNGFVKKNGENVMGAGVAKQIKQQIPDFPYRFGQRLKETNKNVPFFFEEDNIITFPTKHNWYEYSDLQLIDKSCYHLKSLFEWLHPDIYKFKYNAVFIPYLPGIANGGLEEKDVKPIMKKYFNWSKKFVFCKL